MKKKFLFIYLFLFGTLSGINAQISMIGTALTTELDMAQFNLYEFQQQATFTAGNIKFRQGHSWTTNWGSALFVIFRSIILKFMNQLPQN